MSMICFICLFFLLNFLFISAEEEPVVKINDGLIKGIYQVSGNGTTFIAFEGIPYAAPPIGKLRFKEPRPVKPWSGIFLANIKYTCLQQVFLFRDSIEGQEDCLYLNVYVPRRKINPQEKLDVIVFIHGGAFMFGRSSSLSGPKHLMDRDVIFVSLNYRLGPFGFLSAEDSYVTGNFGLKDQSFALQWIKDNIAAFGGNPGSVTVMGLSAGGASVQMHYFSPMSTGLFHRGFAQSGVALNPWALQKHPYENFKKLSSIVGCHNESVPIAVECLRRRSALQIAESIKHFLGDYKLPFSPFAPVVESASDSAFMQTSPSTQLTTKVTNDLPLLISMTTEEGLFPVGFFYNQRDRLNREVETFLPLLLDYVHIPAEEKNRITKILRQKYLKDEPITEENFKDLVKLSTDRNFIVDSVTAAKMHSKVSHSPVHYFLMGYGGDTSIMSKLYTGTDINFGVPHGEDSKFYYDDPLWSNKLTADEKEMQNQLIDMLVDFAKTGNLSLGGVDWKPVSDSESLDYVLVKGPQDIRTKSSKEIAPINFWNSLWLKEDLNTE